jgi:hypothetical protein
MSSLSPAFVDRKNERAPSSKLLLAIVLAPLLLVGAIQLGKAVQSITTQGDNTYPESAVVQTAMWAKTSGRIYPALDGSPYTPAPYGPLFYVALTTLAKLGNMNFYSLLISGRIVSFAVYLLIVAAAYSWNRRHMQGVLALLGPVLILSQVDFVDWNVTVRPDLPALVEKNSGSRLALRIGRRGEAIIHCSAAGHDVVAAVVATFQVGLYFCGHYGSGWRNRDGAAHVEARAFSE